MRLYCSNNDCPFAEEPYKTEKFQRQAHEKDCPQCGARLLTGMERNAKKSGSSLRGGEATAERAAREDFNRLVTEWPCWGKSHRPGHSCWGPIDAHHLIPKNWIRQHFGDLAEPVLLEILFNPIIGAPACRRFHEGLENRSEIIHFHELDDELKVFCQRVDERYPSRPSMLERLKLESPPLSPKKEGV